MARRGWSKKISTFYPQKYVIQAASRADRRDTCLEQTSETLKRQLRPCHQTTCQPMMHAPSKVPTRQTSTRRPPAASNKANDNSSIAWVGPDNVTAFVRCLRLLDLNKRDGWPSITTATFAARSNLQTRIRCTEWCLYFLFEIWDPSYTKDKLRPFFPPQAPLQSLNLRAALFRGLTDLKKSGVLGREVTLRKTMLDECKGDKFEEVLYAIAMIVVRKQAKTRRDSSLNLALADSLNKSQQDALLPLVIAHRHAMAKQVNQRKAGQQQTTKYESYLAHQRQALNDRKKLLEWSLEVPVVRDAGECLLKAISWRSKP